MAFSESKPGISQFETPGIFGGGAKRAKSRQIGGQIEQLLGQGLGPLDFGGGQAGSNLLKSIMEQTSGNAALRGLQTTQGSLAQSIAPTLSNLALQGRQQQLSERGQTLGGLFDLAGLAAPQSFVQPTSKQKSKDFSGLAGSAAGMATAILPLLLSSEKYKENIRELSATEKDNIAEEMLSSEPKEWNYTDKDSKHLGMIVEEAPESVVAKGGDALDIASMFGATMITMKKLNDKISKLENSHG